MAVMIALFGIFAFETSLLAALSITLLFIILIELRIRTVDVQVKWPDDE
jgi:hypothetical protein